MIEVRVIGQTVHYIVDGKSIVEPLPQRVILMLDRLATPNNTALG